jgi:NAD(P)-dependent dehydrogenase (short-subunit alcohol dehydrogenase family)
MAKRKAIFITGGGSGIGRAMAQRFAQGGWFVGLADLSDQGMAETAALLPDGESSRHVLDVRDPNGWHSALGAFATAAGGQIHAVANNAGLSHGGTIIELSDKQVDDMVDVNFKGVINGARAAYPWLKASAPRSCLLNTSSASAFYGVGGMAIYSATKFAVRALTEALDAEWAADRIHVASLMPGFIDTPLLREPANQRTSKTKKDKILAAGFDLVPVEEVAEAAWKAVHGRRLHYPVGQTARLANLASRYAPRYMRYRTRKLMNTRLED